MPNIHALKQRYQELGGIIGKALDDERSGRISDKAFIATVGPLNTEAQEIEATLKAYNQIPAAMRGNAGMGNDGGMRPPALGMRMKGAAACPLHFDENELKGMYDALSHGSTSSIRTKAFSSVDALLPAELQQFIVGPQYENRLLDHLPVQPIQAPSLEYIVHSSTTGAPAIVAEGQPKPELVFVTEPVTATPQKIAAHAATTWEQISDWSRFVSYLTSEMQRQVINVENLELLSGAGTTGHLHGFLSTSGILTHDASTDTGTNVTALDSIEKSIAQLRTGAALAEANLLVLNPLTWSALRRIKSTQGVFLAQPDPTSDEPNSLWGVPVIPTTQMVAGDGLMLDTNKFGFVVVREALSLRTGTNGDDLISNLQRWVCEERLELAVERPAAVLSITNLPTS
jgi:HK97 family phage major capsid protein